MMTWLAPVSARKISPLGATVSKRGRLKSFANTFIWNPLGTVGRNPAGACALSGPLPADLVAKGGGKLGFWPWVTCAEHDSGIETRAAIPVIHFECQCMCSSLGICATQRER